MAVYADVLFVLNLIINYALLSATEKIAKQPTSPPRKLLGAAVGAVYAVCMFFPQAEALYTVAAKLIVSFILVSLSFSVKSPKPFFKTVAVFYAASFVFGGICLGIFYFTGSGKGTLVSNGIFYFNLPLRTLIISTAAAYAAINGLWRIRKSEKARDYRKVKIYMNGKSVSVNALVDTGNMLTDPISSSPVIIAEFEALRSLLPKSFTEIYEKCQAAPEAMLADGEIASPVRGIRVIPYFSLGSEVGMLIGFKPDAVKIGKTTSTDIIIGIYGKYLSSERSYNALLNPEIISTL